MPLDTAAAVKHLRRADPVMRELIKAVGPCELEPGARGDHFTTLLRAIVGQQLSAKAAETIWQRLIALHPNGRKLKPEDVLATKDAELRARRSVQREGGLREGSRGADRVRRARA